MDEIGTRVDSTLRRDDDSTTFRRRVIAICTLAVGTICFVGALTVTGGLSAFLLQTASSNGGDDCMGAAIVPLAMLAGSAVVGFVGLVAATVAGILFWKVSGKHGASATSSADS